MSAANQTAAQQASILLEFFGPNGEKWCQSSFAKDANGLPVERLDGSAVRWCLAGAICKTTGLSFNASAAPGYAPLLAALGLSTLCEFNDSNPWEVVKAKLEEIAAS